MGRCPAKRGDVVIKIETSHFNTLIKSIDKIEVNGIEYNFA